MDVSDLRQLFAAELAEVHTCLPGVIVSYDGMSATVRPALAKQLANGQTLPAPSIVRVPVCWPCGTGGAALITVPLAAGDPVLLHFSERAIEDWLSGADGAPGDPRQFDLSDAFATPVVRPGTVTADLVNVSMQFNGASIKISPGGTIQIFADAVAIQSGSLTHNGVNIGSTHLHIEQGDGMPVSPPQ
jgi:hypothetical protein